MTKRQLFLLALGFVLVSAFGIGGILFIAKQTHRPETKNVEPVRNFTAQKSAVVQSGAGFWKVIEVGEDDNPIAVKASAYFCSKSGAYKGHIIDSNSGWWTVYRHTDKLGSYASEDYARHAIEQEANCE